MRDKTSIKALEWVSLDGRTLDFWVDWGDGRAARPVMLALVDVASNVVLDWELAPSENADPTVRLIKRTCERYGIFDRLYTDNGPAFAGHLVAFGSVHRFRNSKAARTATAAAEVANDYPDSADFQAALAALGAESVASPPKPQRVVAGRFGSPLKTQAKASPEADNSGESAVHLTPEMLRNFDQSIGFQPKAKGAGR